MKDDIQFRMATDADLINIWAIIQYAIEARKADGSMQWQDGYPNKNTIKSDIDNKYGYVLENENSILAYAAVIFDLEPAYEKLKGNWLSDQKYVVIHRVAVSKEAKGKGLAKVILNNIENLALSKNYYSLRMDTNYDNPAMLRIMEKLNYTYCGEVYFRGSARKAFEKVLKSNS